MIINTNPGDFTNVTPDNMVWYTSPTDGQTYLMALSDMVKVTGADLRGRHTDRWTGRATPPYVGAHRAQSEDATAPGPWWGFRF